jgi:outer membrane biosynthesis protein TonB
LAERRRQQRVEAVEPADLIDRWEARRRRDFRRRLLGSAAGHALVILAFAFAPAPQARPLPAALTVDLVAALPAARPAAAKPTPLPPAAAARPKKIVLPKKPSPLPKKPKKVVRPRRPTPQELDYDEALAKLRQEAGEKPPSPDPEPEETVAEPTAARGGTGTTVTPEVARWINDTKRRVRATYVTPPEFLNRGLVTCMTVFLAADGRVIGEPQVHRSSGDPFWDDNAVRALARASPLPAPPGEGDWPFCFPTEDRE